MFRIVAGAMVPWDATDTVDRMIYENSTTEECLILSTKAKMSEGAGIEIELQAILE
jgi:hypothetical protein